MKQQSQTGKIDAIQAEQTDDFSDDAWMLQYWESKVKERTEAVKNLEHKYYRDRRRQTLNLSWVLRDDWTDPEDLATAKQELNEAWFFVSEYKRRLTPLHNLYRLFNAIDVGWLERIVQEAMLQKLELTPNTAFVVHFRHGCVAIETPLKSAHPNFIKALSEKEKDDFIAAAKMKEKQIIHYHNSKRDVNLRPFKNMGGCGLPGFTELEITQIVMEVEKLDR